MLDFSVSVKDLNLLGCNLSRPECVAATKAGDIRVLGNCASIGFGGPDLKTIYIGSLFNHQVATFRSPIAGAVPPHWEF